MAKSINKHLHKARKNKNDEFYTRIEDIEEELQNYKQHFQDRVILCNCNDINGGFHKYFKDNFNLFGLKKLIVTSYNPNGNAMWIECTDRDSVTHTFMGDGDFRSAEVIELLEKADVVVTNPPFSLFREFVVQLMNYKKQFIIVGHQYAVICKDVFPYIKDNKVWLSCGFKGGATHFYSVYEDNAVSGNHKEGMIRVTGVVWYTTFDISKRHKEIKLRCKYDESVYPKYDNYNAIEVSRVANIPKDYDGIMGVPVTFIGKYNPEQFEIIGSTQRGCHELVPDTKKYDDYWEMKQDGTRTGSTGNKTNENANLCRNDGLHNYFINKDGDVVQTVCGRIFIRNRKPEK